MRTEKFNDEIARFCKFIEEWYPSIKKLWVFGSFLYDDSPNDIDVCSENREYSPNPELLKDLFKNIHYEEGGIEKLKEMKVPHALLWTNSKLVELPSFEICQKQYLLETVESLRGQVSELNNVIKKMKEKESPRYYHSEVRTSRSSGGSNSGYGYFGRYW